MEPVDPRIAVTLRTVRRSDLADICAWRAAARPYLRTPFVVTLEQQERFFLDVISDRHASVRYWTVERRVDPLLDSEAVGVAALTGIEWENALAEISIVLAPAWCRRGLGRDVLRLVLGEAFDALRLEQVIAECYLHNPAVHFWRQEAERRGAYRTTLPARKFACGRYHDALYVSFQAAAERGLAG